MVNQRPHELSEVVYVLRNPSYSIDVRLIWEYDLIFALF